MNTVQQAVRRLLRGPRASASLGRLGIDSRRYWLLMDLFDELSDRGEMLDQLGRNGVALRVATWLYAAITALMAVVMVAVPRDLTPRSYLSTFLVLTAFLLLTLLVSEAGNSLVNPVEGLILAHQPVDGATYTAAKLSHLGRIILYLVPAMNAIPAFAGLMVKGAGWSYPLLHLAAALAVGCVAGLFCCALYGWLIRLVPAGRLKAAAQFAGTMPIVAVLWGQRLPALFVRFRLSRYLPSRPEARWAWGFALAAGAMAIVMMGIRSLSADYLIRVSSIMHQRPPRRAMARKSRTGDLVARLFGGQAARAGFAYVCQMARRDFQFRRQAAPMLIAILLGLAPSVARAGRIDPFSGRFTTAHLLPHMLGMALFLICTFLAYGDHYKGAWIFLLVPERAFGGFARGVYAAMWIHIIAIPHLIMLLLFAWPWGWWRAGLFVAYSAAACSIYLALELRVIDSVPFSKQMDPTIGASLFPVIIMGGAAMAIAVGVQFFFVFRSPATTAVVTAAMGAAAYFLTRRSLRDLAGSFRYSLGLLSAESGTLYKEIEL